MCMFFNVLVIRLLVGEARVKCTVSENPWTKYPRAGRIDENSYTNSIAVLRFYNTDNPREYFVLDSLLRLAR